MTRAKISLFIEPDGWDVDDGMTALVKIIGEPESFIVPVRNADKSTDLRARAKFMPWSARVRVRYDAKMLTLSSVVNLMAKVGQQIGVGAGRWDSKTSDGLGWGMFRLDTEHLVEGPA